MLYITFLCDTYFITGRLFLLIGPYLAYLFSPTLLNRKKKNKPTIPKPKQNITLPQRMACSSLMFRWPSSSLSLCLFCLLPRMPCGWWLWIWRSRLAWGEFGDSHKLWWTQPV